MILQDLRFGLRMMARNRGLTTVALVTLALGTGANAAMFSVIDAVLLHVPFADPSRIAKIEVKLSNRATSLVSLDDFHALQADSDVFAAVAGFSGGQPMLTGLGDTRRITLECVSADMFAVLGVSPMLGRAFDASEDRPGGAPVVVVSYNFWRRELGNSADAVGRTLTLDGTSATIVGVMPRGFDGPLSRRLVDGWAPLGPGIDRPSPLGCRPLRGSVNAFARLRAGLTLDQARIRLNTLHGGRIGLVSINDQTFSEIRAPFLALLGAVGFVLLIACANVANLLLERALARRREMAVRLALGAAPGRIVRQMLTESVLLSVAGALAGLIAARSTLSLIVSLVPLYVPRLAEVQLNGRVLAVTLLVACAAGVLVGLMPALQAAAPDVVVALKDSATTTIRSRHWTRRVLVVGELALSVSLLVGAALMIGTFLRLRPSHPGFDFSNKLAASIRLSGPQYQSTPRQAAFFDDLVQRLRVLPGVLAVSGTSYVPLSGSVSDVGFSIVGRPETQEGPRRVWNPIVTPDYLRDMRIPITRGRAFEATDTAAAPAVAIVSEAMARQFWPNGGELGARIAVGEPDRSVVRRLIGVAADVRAFGGDTRTRAELYVPFAQTPIPFLKVIVHTAGTPSPEVIRGIPAQVAAIDPGQVVDRIETMEDLVSRSVATSRFGAWMLGIFAAMAVALAAVGLGAAIAWAVAQRTREIGVRVALGATAGDVVGLILRQAVPVTVIGVAAGLATAAASTRLLASWLFGVTPLDAPTYIGCGTVMVAVALAASYIPARRAAGVDPLIALRAE
jgi:putative ABC transport system permease protein